MTERRAATIRIRRTGIPFGAGAQLRYLGRATAAVAGVIALLDLLGWAFEVPALRMMVPGLPQLRFNAGLGLLLLALTWFVPFLARLVLLGAVTLLSLLTLAEYAFDTSVGIDQLFVSSSHGSHPGRMAVATALSLLLLSLARALGDFGRAGLAQVLAVAVLAIQALTLLGYAYEVPVLDHIQPVPTRAAQAALSLLLLAVAVAASVPGSVLRWSVDAEDAGAMLVRRLLPVALVGLPVIGGVALLGERHGLYSASTAAALIIVACAAVVGAVTWSAAEWLSRLDRRRALAMTELTDLKIDLERQVVERAIQLQRRRSEIAALEDRQRVAAELHDVVIQQLFAAGMFLQGTTTDGDTQQRLDSAVDAMDAAIKDLRASIFELGGRGIVADDVASAIAEICAESAGMLGFRPETTIDDPRLQAAEYREDVLVVLREALANVARHAEAAQVDVALRVRDGTLSLTVADDGQGWGRRPAGIGTQIMQDRARRHGGECMWTAVQPHGTRVHWSVPLH